MIIIATVIIAAGAVSYYLVSKRNGANPQNAVYGTLPPVMPQNAATSSGTETSTSTPVNLDKSLSFSGGAIIYYPSDFNLAANQGQLSVRSYIPPCDQGFGYCIYYNGSAYKGTNFESAGISVRNVTALFPTDNSCTNSLPQGYNKAASISVHSSPYYSVSIFPNLGNAAAGHYATDNIYRLYFGGKCYEFDARIGESQYDNYPAGSIQPFTKDSYDALRAELSGIVGSITLSQGGKISLP